jgi:hypothetical protein
MTDQEEPLPPDVPQRSATATGTAQSVETELEPKRQENVPEGVRQRSDTATGTAEIVPDQPVPPGGVSRPRPGGH